jgi:large subunit ribosomal protein L15
MSLLSGLVPSPGSDRSRKRVGRGKGSGLGQTSAKGHKGQLARTGGRVRRGFEGGQTPLHRRLPKFGFSNETFKTDVSSVNLSSLVKLDITDINTETLVKKGLAKRGFLIKLIGNIEVKNKLNVKVNKISEGAKNSILKAGGKVEVI